MKEVAGLMGLEYADTNTPGSHVPVTNVHSESKNRSEFTTLRVIKPISARNIKICTA